MFCRYCGQTLEIKDGKCVRCGHEVPTLVSSRPIKADELIARREQEERTSVNGQSQARRDQTGQAPAGQKSASGGLQGAELSRRISSMESELAAAREKTRRLLYLAIASGVLAVLSLLIGLLVFSYASSRIANVEDAAEERLAGLEAEHYITKDELEQETKELKSAIKSELSEELHVEQASGEDSSAGSNSAKEIAQIREQLQRQSAEQESIKKDIDSIKKELEEVEDFVDFQKIDGSSEGASEGVAEEAAEEIAGVTEEENENEASVDTQSPQTQYQYGRNTGQTSEPEPSSSIGF